MPPCRVTRDTPSLGNLPCRVHTCVVVCGSASISGGGVFALLAKSLLELLPVLDVAWGALDGFFEPGCGLRPVSLAGGEGGADFSQGCRRGALGDEGVELDLNGGEGGFIARVCSNLVEGFDGAALGLFLAFAAAIEAGMMLRSSWAAARNSARAAAAAAGSRAARQAFRRSICSNSTR